MINIITEGLPPILEARFSELKSNEEKLSRELSTAITESNYGQRKPAENGGEGKKTEKYNGEESSAQTVSFDELAEKIRQFLDNEDLAIEISMDKVTNKMIMKIIDINTKEVVQQIPPEITLKIARIIAESGQLTNAKV